MKNMYKRVLLCIICKAIVLYHAAAFRPDDSPLSVALPYSNPNTSVFVHGGKLNPFGTFGYVLGCTKTRKAAIIDPGGRADFLLELAKSNQFAVKKILLTHEHLDHIAAVDAVARETGAKIYLHKAGMGMYNTFGVPVPYAESSFYQKPWMRSIVKSIHSILLSQNKPGVSKTKLFTTPDYLFNDGAVISVGKLSLRVAHFPGHSPGSVSFFEDNAGVIFSGDIAMMGMVGLTHIPGCDSFAMLRSLTRFRSELSNATKDSVLFTGHAWPILARGELARNKYLDPKNGKWKFATTHMLPNFLVPIAIVSLFALFIRLMMCYISDVREKVHVQ